MKKNWLISSLMVLLGVVLLTRLAVQFGLPSFLKAQTTSAPAGGDPNAIGTHAAFFHADGNIKIANLVKAKGGNKITVMVDISAQAGEINSILAAADGLTKIIRIVGVSHNTSQDASKATGIAQQLNASNIAPGTIVVFGNEVNNLDKEWLLCEGGTCPERTAEAAGEYGAFFRAFSGAADHNKYNPVPSPLDMYNGVYTDYAGFISSSGVYGGDVVANVYDVGTLRLDSPNQYPGHVIAYTEYGPDPAKSLQEHVTFYKTHTPPVLATTLVPDKCNPGTDKWLYYINGKIYDENGAEIDPATCGGSTGHAGLPPAGDYYKRFIYPFYSTSYTTDQIKQKLADDYSMTCTNPAEFGTDASGSIADLIHWQKSNCRNAIDDTACLFQPEATFSVTSGGLNHLFGVMRNENEVKWRAYDYSQPIAEGKREFTNRFESVEQWFGANNISPDTSTLQGQTIDPVQYAGPRPDQINMLHEGPFYKLTPLLAQCTAAGEVLKASTELCQTWSGLPENQGQSCGLVDRKVSGSTRTYGQLYSDVLASGGTFEAFCRSVYENGGTPPSTALANLAYDVAKVDLYQETAYRPAFLVLATAVDPDTAQTNPSNSSQKIKGTDRRGSTGNQIVDFLVYHVPDTITDLKTGEPGDTKDIITRTAETFTPQAITEQHQRDWQDNRSRLAAQIAAAPPSLPAIDCHGGDCDNNKLERALIDFVNAYSVANPEVKCDTRDSADAESGSRIGSQLAPNDTAPQDVAAMKNGKPIDTAEQKIKVEEYRSNDGVLNPKTPPPKTLIYNITPHGMRTKYVADAFDALFTQAQQQGQFQANDKYLTTFEAIFGQTMSGDPDTAEYSMPKLDSNGNFVTDPTTGAVVYDHKEVRDQVHLADPNPASARIPFLAKVFNYSTRAIVQQITSSGQNLLECARSVTDPKKNTEEFLLHCQSRGNAVGSANPSNSPTQYTSYALSDFQQFEIQYWNGHFVQFAIPPQIVWDAIQAASAKHGCDPFLVLATAHSESQAYNNTQTENSATAMGVWQFTRENWDHGVWNLPFFTAPPATSAYVSQDGSNFDCRNPQAETCARTNIYASADAACRLLNAIGTNAQYDNHANFVQAFSVAGNPFNQYGRVWNLYPPQGEYVWRLWHALRERKFDTTYRNQDPTALP